MCCCDFSVEARTSADEKQRKELVRPPQESPTGETLSWSKKKMKKRLREEESAAEKSGKSNYYSLFLNYNIEIFHSRFYCYHFMLR